MHHRILIFMLISAVFLHFPASVTAGYPKRQISDLTSNDVTQINRQRSIIAQLLRENFGYIKLEGYTSDLYYLQKIIDKQLISNGDIYDLQALGVVFGDILVKNLNLSWVVVEDRYGRSRALRFEDSEDLFFPVTMISRRVKTDEKINFRLLYKQIEQTVNQLTYKRSRYQQVPKPKY